MLREPREFRQTLALLLVTLNYNAFDAYSKCKGDKAVLKKHAIYYGLLRCGYSGRFVAFHFGVTPKTVIWGKNRIQDQSYLPEISELKVILDEFSKEHQYYFTNEMPKLRLSNRFLKNKERKNNACKRAYRR